MMDSLNSNRQIFYIDVGNMSSDKVREYLEKIKSGIRNAEIPSKQKIEQLSKE